MSIEVLTSLGILIISLAVLLKSSDYFVEAAEKIGLSFGIPPFVIGVTIVAFGTSLPELASGIVAVLDGDSAILTGNVIGSNIANICLVLGVVAVVARRINMDISVLDIDIPVLVTSAIVLWALTHDEVVDFIDGILLTGMLIVFLINTVRTRPATGGDDELTVDWKPYAVVVLGAFGVFLGAKYTVVGIQQMSDAFGIASGTIAMSAVALGTSLPEVIVSVAAARRGNPDMAIGNVAGSNIFNSFGVMGIPAFFGLVEVPAETIAFSLPFMVGITILFSFFAAARNISRWEGVMLLGLYLIFIVSLFR